MNNRPWSYMEDDIQMPILTQSGIIPEISTMEFEEDVSSIEEKGFEKKNQVYS